jgi:hypothetical protein
VVAAVKYSWSPRNPCITCGVGEYDSRAKTGQCWSCRGEDPVEAVAALEDEVAELQTEIESLQEALDMYGEHRPTCDAKKRPGQPCSCGYEEVKS